MLIKMGVDISRLARPIRRALNHIEEVFQKHGIEPIITSTYEGSHSPGSLHYGNLAVDIRTKGVDECEDIVEELRVNLGAAYDVIWEPNHVHVEYDPK